MMVVRQIIGGLEEGAVRGGSGNLLRCSESICLGSVLACIHKVLTHRGRQPDTQI